MNRMINLVDTFMPLLRINLLDQDNCGINYKMSKESNCCKAYSNYCCGFISVVCCILTALDEYIDFKVIENDPLSTFKSIANMISSFTPYHKCTTECPKNLTYNTTISKYIHTYTNNSVLLGTFYEIANGMTTTHHHFCIYHLDNWVIIIDGWSNSNLRPLWGRIVSKTTFMIFIDFMKISNRDEEANKWLNMFFLIPGSATSFDFSANMRLIFTQFTEEDLTRMYPVTYPVTFAGRTKRRRKKRRQTLF
jgi:hypothetical protein